MGGTTSLLTEVEGTLAERLRGRDRRLRERTVRGWRRGRGFGGRCWRRRETIGEGRTRRLQRRPGQRRPQRTRGRGGWRRRRREGGVGRGRARGRFGLDALGGGFSLSALEEGGACVARGRVERRSGARRRRRVQGRVARGEFGTRRERRVRIGARREERRDRVSSGRRGVSRARERRRPQQRRRGRQDRTGTGSDSICERDGSGGFCDTDSNDDRDGDSRWVKFGCGDAGRDSTELFEGAVGGGVRDRGQQRGRRRQLQRRPGPGRWRLNRDSVSDDGNGDGDSTRLMASCIGGRRERRPRGTAPQTATAGETAARRASTVQRRRDPDRVRDGPRRGA